MCTRGYVFSCIKLSFTYIHISTHTPHYFQCAISPSNYRKIHCPLMSIACRHLQESADWSSWAARECVWTTEPLPRDVNHCLSRDHLHKPTYHPLLQGAVLKDNGKKECKWLENASRRNTVKKIGKGKDDFMFWYVRCAFVWLHECTILHWRLLGSSITGV